MVMLGLLENTYSLKMLSGIHSWYKASVKKFHSKLENSDANLNKNVAAGNIWYPSDVALY